MTSAAIIVMSSTIVARLVGFVREVFIPNSLGTKEVGDAFYLGFLIPDLMYNLLVGGAVAAALIPILSGYIEKKEEEEGWKVIGTFINVVFLAMVTLSLLGIIFAPKLVALVAMGFKGEASELSIRLTRILLPSSAFLMLAGLTNGVLNSYHRFAAASYGPIVYNIFFATSIYVLSRYGVETVAVGVMCSSLLYFLFQLSFALKNIKNYRFRIYLKHPGFIRLIKLAIPSLISSSMMQVNLIIASNFLTFFAAGSVISMNNANKTWQMPYGIFAMGMGIAILPTLSAKLAGGQVDDFRKILMKSLRTVMIFTLPCAVGMAVLSQSVIRTLFKFTDQFDEQAVTRTGIFLAIFSIAMIFHSIALIVIRAFYAANDTKTPLFVGICSVLVNLLFSSIFFFLRIFGAAGIVFAYSIASIVNATLLLYLLNRKMQGIPIREFIGFLFKLALPATVMGGVVFFMDQVPGFIHTQNIAFIKLQQLAYLGVKALVGAGIYFMIVRLMRIEEAIYFIDKIKSKMKSMTARLSGNLTK